MSTTLFYSVTIKLLFLRDCCKLFTEFYYSSDRDTSNLTSWHSCCYQCFSSRCGCRSGYGPGWTEIVCVVSCYVGRNHNSRWCMRQLLNIRLKDGIHLQRKRGKRGMKKIETIITARSSPARCKEALPRAAPQKVLHLTATSLGH